MPSIKHLTYRHNNAARMGTASLPEDFAGQDIVDSRKCCPNNKLILDDLDGFDLLLRSYFDKIQAIRQ